MSVTTVTSWGTVGTLGIVFMGIGNAMEIPLPIVAGMVISGATFGDKISPISDTTNLAAMSASTDLYRHIHSMLFTTLPTFIVVLVIFIVIGLGFTENNFPLDKISQINVALETTFELNLWVTLLPLLVMFGLSMKGYSAEVSMSFSVILAVAIAVLFQDKNWVDAINALWSNSPTETGVQSIDMLLGRGGISSMGWTLFLALMALALGGIL